jgi:hypothetical protein
MLRQADACSISECFRCKCVPLSKISRVCDGPYTDLRSIVDES